MSERLQLIKKYKGSPKLGTIISHWKGFDGKGDFYVVKCKFFKNGNFNLTTFEKNQIEPYIDCWQKLENDE